MKPLYFLLIVLTVSCTVTKRVHQPGYSVQWKGKYTETEQADAQEKKVAIAATDEQTEKETIRSVKTEQSDNLTDDHMKPNKVIEKLTETVSVYIPIERYETPEIETEYEATDGIDENQTQRTTQRPSVNYTEETQETTQTVSEDENAPAGKYAINSMMMGMISFAFLVSGILLVLLFSPYAYLLIIPVFVFSLLAFVFGMKSRNREVASEPNVRRRRVGMILGLIGLGALVILAIGFIVSLANLSSEVNFNTF